MSSIARTLAFSAFVGSALLAGPLLAVAADTETKLSPVTAQPATPAVTAAAPQPQAARETVEQRITSLHTALNITPNEEANWNGVTKAMRGNAVVMDKMIADKLHRDPASLTAVDDLKIYQKFARAHADGLHNLTVSFEILYKTMPDAQKKVADRVFQSFGQHDKAQG